jgi:RNA polymerase sigma-70 factor (ECF subfamily)
MSALASADFERDPARCAAHLYEEHADEVLAYCRRQLRSSEEAEDALQTTFVYALRALQRGVVPDCEAAWLTAIAKNVCLTIRRTAGRRPTEHVDLDRIGLAAPEPGDAEVVDELRAAVEALPETQRRAFLMREWQGLAPREIAARLEATPTATQALLTRARNSVAATLATTVRKPLAGLNLAFLLETARAYVKSLLAGAGAKATAAGAVVAVATVGVGTQLAQKEPPASERNASPARVVAAGDVDRSTLFVRVHPATRAPSRATPVPAPTKRRAAIRRDAQPVVPAPERPTAPITRSVQPPSVLTPPSAEPAPTGAEPTRDPAPAPVADQPTKTKTKPKPKPLVLPLPDLGLDELGLPDLGAGEDDPPVLDPPPIQVPVEGVPEIDLPPVQLPLPPLDLPPLLR